jgi:hypothetical protein
MQETKQSLGEQAARFCLYAPFAVLVIGLLTLGNREQPGVNTAIFTINCLLIVAGFALGMFALLSMHRYGRQRILGRVIIGLLLNTIIIIVTLSTLFPLIRAGRMRGQVVGHWQMQSSPKGIARQFDVTFNKDGTFHFAGSGVGYEAAIDGHWVLTPSFVVGLTVENVAVGDVAAVGKKMGLGVVKAIDARQMVLRTDNGDEVYTRMP